MKTVIAIDPGKSGAVAVFEGGELKQLHDMPTQVDCDACRLDRCGVKHKKTEKQIVDSAKLHKIMKEVLDSNENVEVVVEKVWGMRGDTPQTAFGLGAAYKAVLSVTEILEIPTYLVAAITWKTALSLKKIKKDETTAYASELFPEFDFYTKRGRCLDGRGDAALIGFYAVSNLE